MRLYTQGRRARDLGLLAFGHSATNLQYTQPDPAMNPVMPVWPQRAPTLLSAAPALLQGIRGVLIAQRLPQERKPPT